MQLSNRLVKDDFWTDTELIKNFPPTGRLMYQGLWQLAETTGVLENDPMAYKMQLFPGDSDITLDQIEEWTEKLVELGKLISFQDNGDEYFYIKNFHKHQSFSHPAKPDLPLPDFVEYIPNPEKHKTGAYAIHFGMINGSHEKGTKFIGKPPEDYEKGTGNAQETHAFGTGNEKEKEKEKETNTNSNELESNDSEDGPKTHDFHHNPPDKSPSEYDSKDLIKYFGYLMYEEYDIPYTPKNWGKDGNNAKELINKYGAKTTARAIYWLVNIHNEKPEHFGWVFGSINKFINWRQEKKEHEEYEEWIQEQNERGREIADEVYGNEGGFTKTDGVLGGIE